MSYFPFFIEIQGKKGVVIGGGKHAVYKVQKLLPFEPELTVIAPEMSEEMESLAEKKEQKTKMQNTDDRMAGSLTLCHRNWQESDLEGAAFVIAALSDTEENSRIAELCRAHHILVNVVDQPADCDFYFPAIVKDGPVTVAVSSDGKSPAATTYLRKKVENMMPEGIGAAVELLGAMRAELMEKIPDFKTRTAIFEKLLGKCLETGGQMSEKQLRIYMEELL